MKILVLNAGSSTQKSCLYEFKAEALAAPSQPLWEAEIDWTNHQGEAGLKVATAQGASLEETLKSESRSDATGHMLRTLCSGKTKVIKELSAIDIVGHRVVHGGLEFEQSTFVTPKVKAAIVRPVDALVFTAGIGEQAASVRAAACEAFAFLGLKLDSEKNAQSRLDWDIAAPDSTVRVLVIHAQEDWEIARECWKLTHC